MPQPFVLSLILAMFLAIALLSVAARRLGWGSPLIMLVAGIAIDLIPGVPSITLDPDLMLLGLLPPLLYSSGVGMSWRGFRSNLRPILSMAVGCVLFTASAVAALAHYAFGVSWAAGFVLGAIVSPPDSVAPSTLLRSMRLPRRLQMVLEGESLVNDATALVTFSFAVRAVETNAFSPSRGAHPVRGDHRRRDRLRRRRRLGDLAASPHRQRPSRGNPHRAGHAVFGLLAAASDSAAPASSPAFRRGSTSPGTAATT